MNAVNLYGSDLCIDITVRTLFIFRPQTVLRDQTDLLYINNRILRTEFYTVRTEKKVVVGKQGLRLVRDKLKVIAIEQLGRSATSFYPTGNHMHGN